MAKEASLRLILDSLNASGESPEKTLDQTLTLGGFKSVTPGKRLALAAAAIDQAVTFGPAIAIVVFSHDYAFKIRLVAAQAQLVNTRLFCVWADDEVDALSDTLASVLLSGNGTNEADIEIWILEKP